MTVQQQGQKPIDHNRRRPLWVLIVEAFIILLLLGLVVGAIIVILSLLGTIHIPLSNSISVILLTVIIPVLGAMVPLLQWLFSLPSNKTEPASTQQIIVQMPPASPMPSILPSPNKPTYRGIVGLPPPTDQRTIQQREKTVMEIYKKLTQPDITAIALTGIAGIGKSTLAALVYNYAEERRRTGNGPFTAEAIWLGIDRTVTMIDLTGNIFENLGKPVPDLASMSPQSQAVILFKGLNMVDKPRVVILNQFEDLLDWQTWHALPDRPGIGEWLDAINSQQCTCRILLTSRPFPQGTRDYPPTFMQEFHVDGLDEAEGVELLRKRGVKATEAELRTAIERSGGHAFSLALLASLLQRRDLDLTTLLEDPAYTRFWTGDIARNLLDSIYTQQLDQAQRKLLVAFSVYREPVSLDAVEAVIDVSNELTTSQIESTLDALLAQRVLQTFGEGRYRLHTIVADYAQSHFIIDGNEQINREAIMAAHGKAAVYYEQRAAKLCPPREKRQHITDIHELIEAIWQQCHAQHWQKAYDLMNREGIFKDLRRLGGNAILLELYQLLPLDKWHPQRSEMADVYDKLGQVCRVLGRIHQAQEYYEKALVILRDLGDRLGEGATLNNLGRVYADLGKNEEALLHFEQALIVRREVGDHVGEGKTLNNLGKIYLDLVGQLANNL
jgi:tetratricopeptide (TPR) repeat protein